MLQAGTIVGAYEIVGSLGAGGMGEVYRARDARLGRDVALKVLRPALAAESSYLARFEREARIVAALNHANIVTLHDIGREQGTTYMVTELVDGVSLHGVRLPLRKVIDVGAQIAEALAAAHAAGVTHRDIKPQNVMLTRDGRVKLLDFGIARPGDAAPSVGTTLVETADHAIVGTWGYMAPEQVLGEEVDWRADIFALGAVLHELLSGSPPFARKTATEVMAATLNAEPPELPASVPPQLRDIVHRCLEKSPAERFQSARDLAFSLRHVALPQPVEDSTPGAAVPRRWRLWTAAAMAFAMGVVATGVVAQRWMAAQDATIDAIELTRFTSDRRNELEPAVSPDGLSVAYLRVGGTWTELLVKAVDASDALVLVRSETVLRSPVWSADGNQVCYTEVRRELWCVGGAGGASRRILPDVSWPRMTPDGRHVLFVRAFEGEPWLFRGSLTEPDARRIGAGALPRNVSVLSPVSPDGTSLLALADDRRLLLAVSDAARRREWQAEPGTRGRSVSWLPDSRHVVVAEESTTLIGSRLVIEDTQSAARRLVLRTPDATDGVATFADGKRLVYAAGPVARDLVEYSAAGTFVRTVAGSSLLEGFPTWAPRGDRFVYRLGGPGQADTLWLGASDGAATRVHPMTSNAASQTPISPDGGRVAYADATGIHVVPISGGRSVQVLASAHVSRSLCWSPDGEWLWYSEGPGRLSRVPSAGGAPVQLQAPSGILLDCAPDGRLLFRSGRGGYVLTSPDGGSEREIASAGAYASLADNTVQFGEGGKVLYFLRLDRRTIDVVDVASGRTQRTIPFPLSEGDQIEGFAFAPDGTRVLLTIGGDRNDLWVAAGFAVPSVGWRRWFAHWAPHR